MNKFLYRTVKFLILCGIGIGLLVSAYALWQLGARVDVLSMERYGSHGLTVYAIAIGVLFVLGALGIAIILYRMMCTLDGDPFVEENVRALRRMGFLALGMELCCLLLLVLPANTLIAQFVGAAMALCGLFSLVLSQVFAKAVEHKQELDLTI